MTRGSDLTFCKVGDGATFGIERGDLMICHAGEGVSFGDARGWPDISHSGRRREVSSVFYNDFVARFGDKKKKRENCFWRELSRRGQGSAEPPNPST